MQPLLRAFVQFTVLALTCSGAALAQANLIPNGGFEDDANGDGLADRWDAPHDDGVVVETTIEPGPNGNCQRLACTSYRNVSPASHAMLSQTGTVAFEEGQSYRLTFKAKAEGLPGRMIQFAASDTSVWDEIGRPHGFLLTRDWKEYTYDFRAAKSCPTAARMQFWYTSVGTLWMDDVSLTTTQPRPARWGFEIPPTTAKNLVPNSSFECGTAGWGSLMDLHPWGESLNRLIGDIDKGDAVDGNSSFRVSLDRKTVPVYMWDYFLPYELPVTAPRTMNRGWISVEPGRPYVLSVYLRSDATGAKAVLEVQEADRGCQRQPVTLTTDWRRYTFPFTPSAEQVFVGAGLDLDASALDRATLWMDAVQLERGTEPTACLRRAPTEVGVECEAPGHLFKPGERPFVTLTRAGSPATVHLTVCDFRDDEVLARDVRLADERETVSLDLPQKGFFRVAVSADGAEVVPAEPLRLAVIDGYAASDSAFGMNHAYPWPELLDLSKRIGLTWMRDWTLKWQHVEPEKGNFDFAAGDAQIDRVLDAGLNVIGLLPFPSSNWASTGPGGPDGGAEDRRLMAFMPRDLGDAANYVRETVAHFRGRVSVWEILNEPVYTDYALPRRDGYTVEDYVSYLRAAYRAAKEAQPDCLVIGGVAGPPALLATEFIDAGGLDHVDALNLHQYPGGMPPEAMDAEYAALAAKLRGIGRPVPIWFTEGAYYADDDPPRDPYDGWAQPVESERVCAIWQVKMDAMLLAYGVQKIIYHSGTPGRLNHDELSGIFFEWNGAPRKMVATQAAIASVMGPGPIKGRGRLASPKDTYCYAVDTGGHTVAIMWLDEGSDRDKAPLSLPDSTTAIDVLGDPLRAIALTVGTEPVYIVFDHIASDREIYDIGK